MYQRSGGNSYSGGSGSAPSNRSYNQEYGGLGSAPSNRSYQGYGQSNSDPSDRIWGSGSVSANRSYQEFGDSSSAPINHNQEFGGSASAPLNRNQEFGGSASAPLNRSYQEFGGAGSAPSNRSYQEFGGSGSALSNRSYQEFGGSGPAPSNRSYQEFGGSGSARSYQEFGGSGSAPLNRSNQKYEDDAYQRQGGRNKEYSDREFYSDIPQTESYQQPISGPTRKRPGQAHSYGDLKQQRMENPVSRSGDFESLGGDSVDSKTEKLLQMLAEQNKLIEKQQKIIETRTASHKNEGQMQSQEPSRRQSRGRGQDRGRGRGQNQGLGGKDKGESEIFGPGRGRGQGRKKGDFGFRDQDYGLASSNRESQIYTPSGDDFNYFNTRSKSAPQNDFSTRESNVPQYGRDKSQQELNRFGKSAQPQQSRSLEIDQFLSEAKYKSSDHDKPSAPYIRSVPISKLKGLNQSTKSSLIHGKAQPLMDKTVSYGEYESSFKSSPRKGFEERGISDEFMGTARTAQQRRSWDKDDTYDEYERGFGNSRRKLAHNVDDSFDDATGRQRSDDSRFVRPDEPKLSRERDLRESDYWFGRHSQDSRDPDLDYTRSRKQLSSTLPLSEESPRGRNERDFEYPTNYRGKDRAPSPRTSASSYLDRFDDRLQARSHSMDLPKSRMQTSPYLQGMQKDRLRHAQEVGSRDVPYSRDSGEMEYSFDSQLSRAHSASFADDPYRSREPTFSSSAGFQQARNLVSDISPRQMRNDNLSRQTRSDNSFRESDYFDITSRETGPRQGRGPQVPFSAEFENTMNRSSSMEWDGTRSQNFQQKPRGRFSHLAKPKIAQGSKFQQSFREKYTKRGGRVQPAGGKATQAVKIQQSFREKYRKLNIAAKNNNTKTGTNASREKTKVLKEPEFLDDLFISKKARSRKRARDWQELQKAGGEKTSDTSTKSPRQGEKKVGKPTKSSGSRSSVTPKAKEEESSISIIVSSPTNTGENNQKVPLKSGTPSTAEVSRLKPRTTKIPVEDIQTGNFKNRNRGIGALLHTVKIIAKKDDTITKDTPESEKDKISQKNDKNVTINVKQDQKKTVVGSSSDSHKLTIQVVKAEGVTNKKLLDEKEDVKKDVAAKTESVGSGKMATLVLSHSKTEDKKAKTDGVKKDEGRKEKMDEAKLKEKEEAEKAKKKALEPKTTIKWNIPPAPADKKVTVSLKDKAILFTACGGKAEICDAYKNRVTFTGDTTKGVIEFELVNVDFEDEGVYVASYNGDEFVGPNTKKVVHVKDREDIEMKWKIKPPKEGESVTVYKQNSLTLFTVTGDKAKLTDDYQDRVVFTGNTKEGIISFKLKDCSFGDSGKYCSSCDGEETEGTKIRCHSRGALKTRMSRNRRTNRNKLGKLITALKAMVPKKTSQETLMLAADTAGAVLNVQYWCKQMGPRDFQHKGVIRLTGGVDICLATSSGVTKDEMRVELFDKAVDILRTKDHDVICAMGRKGKDHEESGMGLWDIDTGKIAKIRFRDKNDLFNNIDNADHIEVQRILISLSQNPKNKNKMFAESVKRMYDKQLISLVDVVRSIREREKVLLEEVFHPNLNKLLEFDDSEIQSNEKELEKVGKKGSLDTEKLERFVLCEGRNIGRRMVDAFDWILRSAESCGMLVHWYVRPVYGDDTTRLLPRFFKKCSIWIQGKLVGDGCSYGDKFALQMAAAEALAHIYETFPVIQKVHKGLPEQYCITYKKALAKAKLLMEVGNLDEEEAMIKACADFVVQYKEDDTPESLEFHRGFSEDIFTAIREVSLENNMIVDSSLTEDGTVLTVSKVMDLYKLLSKLLENDGNSGRFRLMRQPLCEQIARNIREGIGRALFLEDSLSNIVSEGDAEVEYMDETGEAMWKESSDEEEGGPSTSKKGKLSGSDGNKRGGSGGNRGGSASNRGGGGVNRGGSSGNRGGLGGNRGENIGKEGGRNRNRRFRNRSGGNRGGGGGNRGGGGGNRGGGGGNQGGAAGGGIWSR